MAGIFDRCDRVIPIITALVAGVIFVSIISSLYAIAVTLVLSAQSFGNFADSLIFLRTELCLPIHSRLYFYCNRNSCNSSREKIRVLEALEMTMISVGSSLLFNIPKKKKKITSCKNNKRTRIKKDG